MRYLLIPAVLAVLFLCGYLAACAGGERWLTLREWLGKPRTTSPSRATDGGNPHTSSQGD